VSSNRCLICNSIAETVRPGLRDAIEIHCPKCGSFIVTGTAEAMLPSRLGRDNLASARASYFIRSHTPTTGLLEIDSTMVDDVVSFALPPPHQQLANLVAWIRNNSQDVAFVPVALPIREALAAIVGAVDKAACGQLLQWAQKEGIIQLSDAERQAALTPRGWEASEPKSVERRQTMPESQASNERVFAHCPQCGPKIRADVVASHEERSEDDDSPVWAVDTYSILKCRGCETIYVQHRHVFSEDEEYEKNPVSGEYEPVIHPRITYWPAPARRQRPDWVSNLNDDVLRSILEEVYGALDNDHRVLAAIGARAVIDRAMALKGATEKFGFAQKLTELKDGGVIGQNEKDILLILTDAGSAATHRGWRPSPSELSTIMDGTEAFLNRVFIVGDAVAAIKGAVPPRPTRP